MGIHRSADSTRSASSAVAITPHATTEFAVTRALFVGVGGNIACRMADGTLPIFLNVAAGIFPVQVDKVLATGTTATDMFALY